MAQQEVPRDIEPRIDLSAIDNLDRVSLCEALDRVLEKGAVVAGQVTISVADVELVYLGLELVLASVETARRGSGPGGVGLTLSVGKERSDAGEWDGARRA